MGGGAVLAGSLIRSVHEKDWGAIAELVDGDASSIAGSDAAGRCLLHYVIWKAAPPSLLHAVLDADASAAGRADRDRRHPLHFAGCDHDAKAKYASFVEKLIAAAPEAAEAADKHGRTALHYAYWRGASQKVTDALVAANPGAAEVMDSKKKLPVRGTRIAAEHDACPSLAARLLFFCVCVVFFL